MEKSQVFFMKLIKKVFDNIKKFSFLIDINRVFDFCIMVTAYEKEK